MRLFRRIQLGPVHRDTINCLAQLGHATVKQERWVTAQKLYQLARAQCQARPVSSVVHTSRGLRAHSCENAAYTEVIDGHLAHVALQLGEGAQALKLWKAQARRQGRRQGTDHPSYAATLNSIGNALLQLGRQADALLAYNRSAGVFASAKGYGPNCPGCATVYTNIGSLYYSADEFDHARRYYIRARAIRERELGPTHLDTAACHSNLGLVFHKMGKLQQAEAAFKQAEAICSVAAGATDSTLAARRNVAWCRREVSARRARAVQGFVCSTMKVKRFAGEQPPEVREQA